MRAKHTIVGVNITDRVQHAEEIQKVLTGYGCHIKTRLGLHEVSRGYCAGYGVVLLEVIGAPAKIAAMVKQLKKIEGVQVKTMVFTH
ncbi:MAG TPA: hypothetical protein PKX48_05015 [Planctomycetota bacterium]|nr:hypothetical protein [Planctomycetota bacterium]OQC21820.1 MAG: hypothetical protein BWX69_00465 [Planctomycetes bacterium ADurb.Bin069]HNR98229.1 hypothetical protein [Planctomycetota bacterium]HNU24902.1 hypothetical protein [Planctomycetota bacterium]HOE29504.1 hypothetical protein [Planctomycetota bacterium]